mmetsp:Transcript_33550/g.41167  ORF Transcript_33550/g.41167 Transcript_33550/m.41167 type:complete len:227 (-) Transcript_33550:1015-1695(-)
MVRKTMKQLLTLAILCFRTAISFSTIFLLNFFSEFCLEISLKSNSSRNVWENMRKGFRPLPFFSAEAIGPFLSIVKPDGFFFIEEDLTLCTFFFNTSSFNRSCFSFKSFINSSCLTFFFIFRNSSSFSCSRRLRSSTSDSCFAMSPPLPGSEPSTLGIPTPRSGSSIIAGSDFVTVLVPRRDVTLLTLSRIFDFSGLCSYRVTLKSPITLSGLGGTSHLLKPRYRN